MSKIVCQSILTFWHKRLIQGIDKVMLDSSTGNHEFLKFCTNQSIRCCDILLED